MNELDNYEGKQNEPFYYSEAMERFVHGNGCDRIGEAPTPILEVLKVITVDGINGDSGGFGVTYQDMPYQAELQSYLRCDGCGVEVQYQDPLYFLENDEIQEDPMLCEMVTKLAGHNRLVSVERIRGVEHMLIISDTEFDLGSTVYRRLYDETKKTLIPISSGHLTKNIASVVLREDPLVRVKEVFRQR